jgi:hypothetical protein
VRCLWTAPFLSAIGLTITGRQNDTEQARGVDVLVLELHLDIPRGVAKAGGSAFEMLSFNDIRPGVHFVFSTIGESS